MSKPLVRLPWIDTTTPGGKLVFHVFAALAEFERDLIKERTRAGLVAAKARGRIGGRPKAMDQKTISLAKAMLVSKENSVLTICETLKVSKATLYRYTKSIADNASHTAK